MCVVTGGTGFIGSHLVDHLVAAGHRVRILARRAVAPRASVEGVRGDIRDRGAVRTALDGADVVFHLAGYAKAWARHPSVFDEVNRGGTQNVCDEAGAAGVRRVVHMSTSLLEAPSDPALSVDFTRTAYQRSKADAERVVANHVETGASAVIVRPSRTFGPGPLHQSNSVTKLIDLHRRGLFRLRLADRDARGNYVYVRDVVRGLVAAARCGVDGHAYALGGADRSLLGFLAEIDAITGTRRRVWALPWPGVRTVATACEGLAQLGIEPLITNDWADLLRTDWPIASTEAETQLGYRPTPLPDAIAKTIAWLDGSRTNLCADP